MSLKLGLIRLLSEYMRPSITEETKGHDDASVDPAFDEFRVHGIAGVGSACKPQDPDLPSFDIDRQFHGEAQN